LPGPRAGLELLFDVVTDAWQPGDVLLLAVGPLLQPVHLAAYAGEGRMIHCYSRGPQRVIEVPMGAIWRGAVVAAFRWREPANG
jgi:cell wall-associated NlpC family hydrolase